LKPTNQPKGEFIWPKQEGEIGQLEREVALIIEALEKLDVYKFQGLENATTGEAAPDRYRDIVKQLKAIHTSKK